MNVFGFDAPQPACVAVAALDLGEICYVDCPVCWRRWPVEGTFLIFAGIAVVVIVLTVFAGRMHPKGLRAQERVRRGTGHALLGLQEFIEPSVEYVFQAQNVEQREEGDDEGQGGDAEEIRSDLAEALSRTPVDREEVRRHLSAAVRARMDWKALFEQAVDDELRERPFRAPSIPPIWHVAPESDYRPRLVRRWFGFWTA